MGDKSVTSTMIQLYYSMLKEYPSVATLERKKGKGSVIETYQVGNVDLTCHVWKSLTADEVCCGITASPNKGGDGINYLNEFIMMCLNQFKGVTVRSDHNGIYLTW